MYCSTPDFERRVSVAFGVAAAVGIALGAAAIGGAQGQKDLCNVTVIESCRAWAVASKGSRELIHDRSWRRRACRSLDQSLLNETIPCFSFDKYYLVDDAGDRSAAFAMVILAVNCLGLAGIAHVAGMSHARAEPISAGLFT